ncbi:putative chromosome partitioning ATPase ParA [Selenomonas ruminantium subsp. lactilytica TAM6421]|uniref:Putative chromosome partitioning ATPase ParA n=1 Tax=Selenomonas ruminantium subsp. lactilytica (strain NBRC 103574 / TAM6421) TaxID=927704 RepID=I0GQB0_SELRL|nr:AAA family ATPase [Selenomonas ruminantium]BAL82947.1 putative chromosome partitioning ATPase ParA [Selenomonas ruminantium subsp. lactilytica TAM6421]
MRIISFINKKGGVGKTTIVVNLAYALKERYDARVLVVDNDEQGNVSQFFDGKGKYSLADVLLERVEIEKVVEQTRYEGIDLVRADFSLADANVELREMDKSGKEWQLKNALDCLAGNYDVCLIDNPPQINASMVNSLVASDEVVVVSTTDKFSIYGVQQMLSCIKDAQQLNPHMSYRGTVVNMFAGDGDSLAAIAQLRQETEVLPVMLHKTDGGIRVKTATNRMETIFEYSPRCRFARDMVEFMDYLLGA